MDLKKLMTGTCPFPQVFDNKDKAKDNRPESELAYFRCDYDGYRWWNTVWPVNKALETDDLIDEMDAVYDALQNQVNATNTALETKADRNAGNLNASDVDAWQSKLGDGAVAANDAGLFLHPSHMSNHTNNLVDGFFCRLILWAMSLV